jgi:hypothetical protein
MRTDQKTGFPAQVREIFDALRNEVTFVHGNWEAFQQLYGSPESVAALNETAPGAFRLIRFIFRHEFIMAFSRITDPKATSGKENLTLKQLLHVVGDHCTDHGFLARLAIKEQAIAAHCKPIREHRNRSIGHLDLKTALNFHPDPLPDIDSAHVIEALRLVADFMNEILGYYTSAHADFVPVVAGPARNFRITFGESSNGTEQKVQKGQRIEKAISCTISSRNRQQDQSGPP